MFFKIYLFPPFKLFKTVDVLVGQNIREIRFESINLSVYDRKSSLLSLVAET
jgi:hypothetical protein